MEHQTVYLDLNSEEKVCMLFPTEKFNNLVSKLKKDIETIKKYKLGLQYLYQPIEEYVDSVWLKDIDMYGEDFIFPYINVKISTGEVFIGMKYSDNDEVIIKEQKVFNIDI